MGASGTNVNQWHWTEKDATPWAKKRIEELLVGMKLGNVGNTFCAEITGLDKFEGDVILNVRKAKLIAAYELDITLSWHGEKRDDSGACTAFTDGKLQIPYLSEENHDEDPELRVTTASSTSDAEHIRQFFINEARPQIFKALQQLVQEIHAGGPQGAGPTSTAAPASLPKVTDHSSSAAAAKPAKAKAAAAPKSYTSLQLKETFHASPQDLYECFTDARRIMAFTQSPAEVEPRVGGRLSMYGGAVQCTFRELRPAQAIHMDWRFNTWTDGVVSKVALTLESPSAGTTILKVDHSGIPEQDKFGNEDVIGNVERGWQQQMFHRIKAVFGFGV